MTNNFQPGDTVFGPFWSDSPRNPRGLGIVTEPGRALWTRVPDGYLAIRVIVGDRASGGYAPDTLRPAPFDCVNVRTGP